METIIIGALPPSSVADETARHMEKTAPVLTRLFQHASARVYDADPDQTGCTSYEAWLLHHYQFEPQGEQLLSAGLAPLLVPGQRPDEPLWLFQLAHFGLSNSGAHMLTADDIGVTEQESLALYESAREIVADTPFTLKSHSSHGWTVGVPESFNLPSRSPGLIASADLAHIWPQEESVRPLRRLLSELQIAWHHHPVNETRRNAQMPLINGGWLFGGACSSQIKAADAAPPHVINALAQAHRQHQWGHWVAQLPTVEQQVIQQLGSAIHPGSSGNPVTMPVSLVLTGADRWVTLTLEPTPAMLKWLPAKRKQWKQWWSQ